MKCLVVDVAIQTKENVNTCWLTMTKLARWKDDKQKLYHQKKSEIVKMMAVSEADKPAMFKLVANLLPGTLVELEQAVNEYDKPVIKDIKVLKQSPYSFNDLYK